jgi:hypothetical protein
MTFNLNDVPDRLDVKFGPFGNPPFIIDGITRERLTLQQITNGYNMLMAAYIEKLESDVD